MSKEELENKVTELLEEFEFDHDKEGWAKSIIRIVYNKGLEDAANSIDPELCNYEESSVCTQDEVVEGILKLKI